MYNEVFDSQDIFDKDGNVINYGWSRNQSFNYNIHEVKLRAQRISGWDYYIIYNEKCFLTLGQKVKGNNITISVSLINLEDGKEYSSNHRKFEFGKSVDLPTSLEHGDIAYSNNNLGIKFSKVASKRYINCDFANFYEGKTLYINLILTEDNSDSISLLKRVSENNKEFFLRQRINCMTAQGKVKLGGDVYHFSEIDSLAELEWGRTGGKYRGEVCALYGSGQVSGHKIGIHIDNIKRKNSEELDTFFFYDGKLYELPKVNFNITDCDSDICIKIQSNDNNKVNLEFRPQFETKNICFLNKDSCDDKKLIGRCSGRITFGSNKEVEIDNLLCYVLMSKKWNIG